jgi:pyrroloquinoline quinone (PQQ) biosynthesis protein C
MNKTYEITVEVVTVKRNANGKAVGMKREIENLVLTANTLEELKEKKALLTRMAEAVGMEVTGFLAREVETKTVCI